MAGRTVAWRVRFMSAIAAGLLVSTGVISSAASDATPAAVLRKLENHDMVWTKLAATPGARLPVIVRFDMPALPDAASFASPAAADDAQTKAIHAAQDRILATAFPSGELSATAAAEKSLKRMDFSPMFGIVASAEEVARFAADPNVTAIQEDRLSRPLLSESLPLIQMPAMYAAGASGNGYHVAVLDTGGRRGHQFLSSRINSEACYNTTGIEGSVSQCPGGASSSIATGSGEDCTASNIFGCGHGTHVAGTVAGYNTAPASGQPASGVARDARLISINVFSRFPANSGSPCGAIPGYAYCVLTFDTDQIRGLERVYALRNKYKIAAVNMSLGGGQYTAHCDSDARKPIIDQLKAARIATVIAAGNDGYDTAVGAPGCISSAVTVGSSDKWDYRSDFSNWGNLVDVVAPGTDIYSSYINGSSNSYFSFSSGTSMASPHVAGAFATLRHAFPNATVDQIENALKSTGEAISSAGVVKPRIKVNDARIVLGGGTPPPTGPANNHFVNRITVPLPAFGGTRTVTGTNVEGTAESGEPIHAGKHSALNSVWWRYTPTASGSITIDTLGSNFDTVLGVYRGSSLVSLVEVASNDDADYYTIQSQVTFNGTAGVEYQIAVAGYMNGSGNIRLNVSGGVAAPLPPANDNFASSKAVTTLPPPGVTTAVTGSNVAATAESGEPYHAGVSSARNSVWWRFRPSSTGLVTLSTVGSSFDTVLAVYTGSSVNGLNLVASNNDISGSVSQSRVTFQATAGTLYRVAVAGVGNASGNIKMNIKGGGTTPPVNDNFADSRGFTFPFDGAARNITGTNRGATAQSGEPNHAGVSTARNSVWWRIRPSQTGTVTLSTVGSDFDTVLAVYRGSSVNGLTHVASNNNVSSSVRQSRLTFHGTAGVLYQVAVAGVGNAAGNIKLNARGTPSGGAALVAGAASSGFEPVDVSVEGGAVAAVDTAPAAGPDVTVASLTSPATATVETPRPDVSTAGLAAAGKGTGQAPATIAATAAAAPAAVDLVSTVVTPSNDGILRVPAGGDSVAVLAVNNAGATAATLTAQLSLSPAEGASAALPDGLSLCRTDAGTGACIGARGSSVTFTAEPGEVVTFAAFVSDRGEAVALDPAANRLHVHFRQGGNTVGTASLPFCTADTAGCASKDAALNTTLLNSAL